MNEQATQQSNKNLWIFLALTVLTLVSVGSATHWTFQMYKADWNLLLMAELCLIAAVKAGLILHYYMELGKAPLKFQFMAYLLIALVCISILKMRLIVDVLSGVRFLV